MHFHSSEPLHMAFLLLEILFPFFGAIKSLPMGLSSATPALGVPACSCLRSLESLPLLVVPAAQCGSLCMGCSVPSLPEFNCLSHTFTKHLLHVRHCAGLSRHRGKSDKCVSAFAGLVAWHGKQDNAQDQWRPKSCGGAG